MFPDTDANHHVTPDITSMTYAEPYLGNDQLQVGDGSGSAVQALSSSDSPSVADSPASSSALSSPSGHSA